MATRGVLMIWLFLVAVLVSGCTAAHIKGIKLSDPIARINYRSPFDEWINAYNCLQNKSSTCPDNFQLTESGLTIQRNETSAFCNSTCPYHAKLVLGCLSVVKHDFLFRTRSNIWDLYTAISDGCSSGFNGTTPVNGASYNKRGSLIGVVVAAIAAWIVLATS